MLTGRPPFQAASPVDTVLLVLEQDPVPPRMLNPKADRDLEMICLRCLQKPADLRYASAAALADDLEAYLNDESISARSGRFAQMLAGMMRETHHAAVLENWGLLWMWHSLALLVACFATNTLELLGDNDRLPYFLLWTAGLGAWAAVFWALRRRMGPVTFVERQIAHLWAGSMICIALLFPLECLARPARRSTLSPVLGLVTGMVFLAKAGILSGEFYVRAVALFAHRRPDGPLPDYAHFIFGIVSAACFFFPGLEILSPATAGDRGGAAGRAIALANPVGRTCLPTASAVMVIAVEAPPEAGGSSDRQQRAKAASDCYSIYVALAAGPHATRRGLLRRPRLDDS